MQETICGFCIRLHSFKTTFRVHKSDFITGKDKCGVAKHFLTKYTDGKNVENIDAQVMEQVQKGNFDLKGNLRCIEKYCQAHLVTLSQGISSTWEFINSISNINFVILFSNSKMEKTSFKLITTLDRSYLFVGNIWNNKKVL